MNFFSNFFRRRNFTSFRSKIFRIWDHLFTLLFPQGFQISNKFGHWTSGSKGKNWVRKCDVQTDKQTNKHTETFRLMESLGPEGRCFKNPAHRRQRIYCRKNNFFLPGDLTPFMRISFQIWDLFLPLLFPKDKKKMFYNKTLGRGFKKWKKNCCGNFTLSMSKSFQKTNEHKNTKLYKLSPQKLVKGPHSGPYLLVT